MWSTAKGTITAREPTGRHSPLAHEEECRPQVLTWLLYPLSYKHVSDMFESSYRKGGAEESMPVPGN